MKKIGLIVFALGLAGLMACNDPNESTKTDCIHCVGCFSEWDECKEDYRPADGDTLTWEEYSEYMVSNPSAGTWGCTRVN